MEIISRLKRLNYEHFVDLVKMHLSLCMDVSFDQLSLQNDQNINSSKRSTFGPFKSKKPKTHYQPSNKDLFCECLTEEGVCRLYIIIQFLHREINMKQEGLFRKSGSMARQQELRNRLSRGNLFDLDCGTYSAHDCATVLKNVLADLPEPLLLESCFNLYLQIGEIQAKDDCMLQKQVNSIKLLLLLLPSQNYALLKDLLLLLHNVQLYQIHNKMNSKNLATLIAPHILCSRKMSAEMLHSKSELLTRIVQIMIEHGPVLFSPPPSLLNDVKLYWERKTQSCLDSKGNEPIVTTVTFVDRQKSAEENEKCPTAVALAELYAHVQSLPPSGRRDQLMKHICRYNREHGPTTPLPNSSLNGNRKSLSSNIKRYLRKPKLVNENTTESCRQNQSATPPYSSTPLPGHERVSCLGQDTPTAIARMSVVTSAHNSSNFTNQGDNTTSPLDKDSPLSNTLRLLPPYYKETVLTPCSRTPLACPPLHLNFDSPSNSFSVIAQLSFGSKTTDDSEESTVGQSILSSTVHINLSNEELTTETNESAEHSGHVLTPEKSDDSLAPYLNQTPENSLLMFLDGDFPDNATSNSPLAKDEKCPGPSHDDTSNGNSQCESSSTTQILFETVI